MSTTTTSHKNNKNDNHDNVCNDDDDTNADEFNENPTRTILEHTLAALDNGKYALSFPSGTAGQSCLIATLKAGDGIICGGNIYTGTIELFRETGEISVCVFT